jgi:hypothetical protein
MSADLVDSEVKRVSQRLLSQAHFTDHVAMPTGRVAEHLRLTQPEPPEAMRRTGTRARANRNWLGALKRRTLLLQVRKLILRVGREFPVSRDWSWKG